MILFPLKLIETKTELNSSKVIKSKNTPNMSFILMFHTHKSVVIEQLILRHCGALGTIFMSLDLDATPRRHFLKKHHKSKVMLSKGQVQHRSSIESGGLSKVCLIYTEWIHDDDGFLHSAGVCLWWPLMVGLFGYLLVFCCCNFFKKERSNLILN